MKDSRYVYLGSDRWVTRESVPAPLLAKYDRTWAAVENNPSVIDPATSRIVGALWLDTVDEIAKTAGPVLDHEAMLQDRELRDRAAERGLEVLFSQKMPLP